MCTGTGGLYNDVSSMCYKLRSIRLSMKLTMLSNVLPFFSVAFALPDRSLGE